MGWGMLNPNDFNNINLIDISLLNDIREEWKWETFIKYLRLWFIKNNNKPCVD